MRTILNATQNLCCRLRTRPVNIRGSSKRVRNESRTNDLHNLNSNNTVTRDCDQKSAENNAKARTCGCQSNHSPIVCRWIVSVCIIHSLTCLSTALPRQTRIAISLGVCGVAIAGLLISDMLEKKLPIPEKTRPDSMGVERCVSLTYIANGSSNR